MNIIAVLSQSLSAEQELSYQNFENDELSGSDIHSITCKWCSFSDIKFLSCKLYDSDWEGCQLNNVTFQDVPMQKSDITSVIFEGCTFINTIFQNASISDVTFIHCQFERCDLNHVGMTDSSFYNCSFQHMELLQSSSWLNSFTECTFTDFTLKGNFYYNFMIQNQYVKFTLDPFLIASNYGFTAKELDLLGIDKKTLHTECQSYQNKKNFMAFAIMKLNLEDNCYDYKVSLAIQTILRQLQNGIVVRREQIEFIHRIWQKLTNEHRLSLYTTLYNMLQIQKFLSTGIMTAAAQKAHSSMSSLYQLLIQTYQNLMLYIQRDCQPDIEIRPFYIVKITYHEEPQIPITMLLEQLIQEQHITCAVPVRIKTMSGSFIEFLQMAQPILPYFSILIGLLGYIHTIKKDANHKPETKAGNIYIQNNNFTINTFIINQTGDGTLVPSSANEISPVIERQILDVFQILSKHKILDNENMYGYNSYNIIDAEIMLDNTFPNNK